MCVYVGMCWLLVHCSTEPFHGSLHHDIQEVDLVINVYLFGELNLGIKTIQVSWNWSSWSLQRVAIRQMCRAHI